MSLGLFQFTMSIYFYFYKSATLMSIIVVVCSLITFATGVYVNFIYFAKLKVMRNQQDGLEEVDGEIFRDAYLHPCFIEERRRAHDRDTALEGGQAGVPADLLGFVGKALPEEEDSDSQLELRQYEARQQAAQRDRMEFAARQGLDLGDGPGLGINSGLDDLEYLDTPAVLDIPSRRPDDDL